MANDTYSAASGQGIYAGRFNLPAWRQNLAVNEWVAIPLTTSLQSIDPANNPAINQNHPNPAPWRAVNGFASIMTAWCGACYDDTTGTFMIPIGGGHDDYAGNEPYKCNMFADSTVWQMIRNPSGAIGNQIVLDDGQENTGLYSDGRLRAAHSYSLATAGNGRFFITALPAIYRSGQAGKAKCYEINPFTGESSLISDYSSFNLSDLYGAGSYDPDRDELMAAHRQSGRFIRISVDTGVAVSLGSYSNYFAGYITGNYAKSLDRHLFFGKQTTNTAFTAHRGLAVIDPSTGSKIFPYVPDLPLFVNQDGIGAVWQDSQKRLLIWNNNTDTNKVIAIKPSNYSDLSQAWTMETITGFGATPTTALTNGTFNRLQYSNKLGGLMLINAVNQPFYFMRAE